MNNLAEIQLLIVDGKPTKSIYKLPYKINVQKTISAHGFDCCYCF